MRLLLVIIYVLSCSYANSQDPDSAIEIIKSLSKLRTKVLVNVGDDIELLVETIETWRTLEPDEIQLKNFIFQVQYAKEIGGRSNEWIIENAPRRFSNSLLSRNITEDQINALTINSQLTDLIVNKVLSTTYPYGLHPNVNLFKEIDFYNIQEYETIAEIGAGKGVFSQILYMLGKKNKIIVNEINRDLLGYFFEQLQKGYLEENGSEILLAIGTEKKINIGIKVEKIIIRNSFHHFEKKRRMLKSISKSLKEGGSLYIYEILRDPINPKGCNLRMTEQEIQKILSKTKWVNTDKLLLDGALVLEYKHRD